MKTLSRLALVPIAFGLLLLVGTAQDIPRKEKSPTIDTVFLRLIDEVDMPAQVAGVIDQIHHHEGDRVEAGTLLVSLQSADAELAFEQAELERSIAVKQSESEARLQQVRAMVDEAKGAAEKAQIEVDVAKRKAENGIPLLSAKRSAEVAKAEYERAVASKKNVANSVSDNELEHLQLASDRAALEVAQVKHDQEVAKLAAKSKEAELDALLATCDRRRAELVQAEEDHATAKLTAQAKSNAVRAAQLAVNRHRLKSPISGEIAAIPRHRGEWVEPGEKVIRLVRLDRLRAEGFLPAAVARRELLGKPAKFILTLDGNTREYAGTVTFVSSEIDPVNEQVHIWAEIDNPAPDFPLQPGLKGKLRL